MRAGEASRTAEFMALYRAMEFSRSAGQRLFEDRLAESFLRRPLRLALWLSRLPMLGGLVPVVLDLAAPGARSSGIARTRLIDELVCRALDDGAEQVVILGVGFDCRAYRLPGIERCPVFEVDHPDTLAAKRRRLAHVLPRIPDNVRFVETDFNQGELEKAVGGSGYDPCRRSCFIWEGVTNYLTDAAVDGMFRWFAGAAAESVVIFTYVDRAVLTDPDAFLGARRLLATMERLGERWTFGFDPLELPAYLARFGLELTIDVNATQYRAQYMGRQSSHMRGYEFYRVAVARVLGGSR